MSSPSFLSGGAALTHLGVIRATGADAASFLHGQLTSDFALLDTSRVRLAGYCSAKGRLLATFIGWKTSPEEVLLVCSADVLPATLKRLSMFVMRAKCKLTDATAESTLLGLAGDAVKAAAGADPLPDVWHRTAAGPAQLVRLPDVDGVPRAMWLAPKDVPAPAVPALPLDVWRWSEVHSGVPSIEAATADQFVPQMVNFELLGGVDFKKGCYPGQEVVARSQYRGTIKRRAYLFDSAAPAAAGQEIFHSDDPGQPAGLVVNAAAAHAGAAAASLLAEVKLAALGSGTLHLGRADGPRLDPLPMPYDVTTEAAD